MSCLHPLDAWHRKGGGRITLSGKLGDPELSPFKIPCGKCIECRLDYSLEWAMRCEHEAYTRPGIFITLTYRDPLKSPSLCYEDYARFINTLRKTAGPGLGFYVCGEYGAETKRPHWHALLFGYQPSDAVPYKKNKQGDQLFTSETIDNIWGENDPELHPTAIGDLTFKSAAYVARYSAKKLVHGNDQDHSFHPIAKMSRKYAIGKSFLELFHQEIFDSGFCMTSEKNRRPIPRYYARWFQKHHPGAWKQWLENHKLRQISIGETKRKEELDHFWETYDDRIKKGSLSYKVPLQRPDERKKELARLKLQKLNERLS